MPVPAAAPPVLWVILAAGLLFLALVLVRSLFALVADVRALAERTRAAAALLTEVQRDARTQAERASERLTRIGEGTRTLRRSGRGGRGRMSQDDQER